MARLTWAKKLNNRLKRNWNIEIDYSKCFIAAACGKRSSYNHRPENPLSDSRWEQVYNYLLKANKKDHITIEYYTKYEWNEDYEHALQCESEYYGYCYGYAVIVVTTPIGKQKLCIDTRYV